jgi:uncharacterized protein (TIGR04540 family)
MGSNGVEKVQKEFKFMDILKNPTTVKSLAIQIITACDGYVALKMSEKQLKELITHYASQHGKKLFSRNGLNPTIIKRIGKKRVELVNIMLSGFQSRLWD